MDISKSYSFVDAPIRVIVTVSFEVKLPLSTMLNSKEYTPYRLISTEAYKVLPLVIVTCSRGPEIVLQEELVILFSGSLDFLPSRGKKTFALQEERGSVDSAPALATRG